MITVAAAVIPKAKRMAGGAETGSSLSALRINIALAIFR